MRSARYGEMNAVRVMQHESAKSFETYAAERNGTGWSVECDPAKQRRACEVGERMDIMNVFACGRTRGETGGGWEGI